MRRGALLAAALLLPGASCPEPVAIDAPAADGVTLSSSAEAEISLWPPLGPDEWIEAKVRSLSGPGGPVKEDLTDALVLAPGRDAAELAFDLAPGLNVLVVSRVRAQGKERTVSTAKRVLDRGGYPGAKLRPFGVAPEHRTLSRPATLTPGAERVLPVAIWYPAALDPDPSVIGTVVPPPPGAAALPTVVFSHGNCGFAAQSSYLMEDLAAIGFLVVAPGHVGNRADDPGCSDFLLEAFEERLDDVRAVLDALPVWSATPGDPIEGLFDPSRLGLMGYSAGGFTVLPIVAEDPDVAAFVTLATPVANPDLFPLPVPGMVVAGTLDTTAPASWVRMFLYDLMAAPRFMATIVDATHGSFATACPEEACVLGEASHAELHARIVRIVRAFLGRHLARDVRFEALLVREEGTRLRADP